MPTRRKKATGNKKFANRTAKQTTKNELLKMKTQPNHECNLDDNDQESSWVISRKGDKGNYGYNTPKDTNITYKTSDSDIFPICQNMYAVIDRTILKKLTKEIGGEKILANAKNKLEENGLAAREKNAQGLKIVHGLAKLKLMKDKQLYTNKTYQNEEGYKLIVLDNIGKHKETDKKASEFKTSIIQPCFSDKTFQYFSPLEDFTNQRLDELDNCDYDFLVKERIEDLPDSQESEISGNLYSDFDNDFFSNFSE